MLYSSLVESLLHILMSVQDDLEIFAKELGYSIYAFTVSMTINRALLCLAALLAICMMASGIERAKYAHAREFTTTKYLHKRNTCKFCDS